MRKVIVINGKSYPTAELDFENVCKMEDFGASLTDAESKPMNVMRGYLALCMKSIPDLAGKELEAHILSGGNFTELADALKEAIDDSGFFQALIKSQEEETQTSSAKAKQSKK